MSSDETYKKNKAILNAEKTKPTSGTIIGGKKVAVIFYLLYFNRVQTYNMILYIKRIIFKY